MNPLLLGLLIGLPFGAVLVLSGLADPKLIIGMLRLKDLRLLKLLVTAIGAGIVGIALLDSAGLANTSIKTTHVIANLAGGAIFGLGFAISGYCPGTALAGAAEGRRDALFAVLGGLLGTALFTALFGFLGPALIEPLSLGKITIPSILGVPALLVALPAGAAAAFAVYKWKTAAETSGPVPAETRRPEDSPVEVLH